jgi:hypothetical protein
MKEKYNKDTESLKKKIKQILEIKIPLNQLKIQVKATCIKRKKNFKA